MDYASFIGPSSTAQSALVDQERTMNLYVEVSESKGAASKLALYQIPGVTEIDTTGRLLGGVGRAHIYIGGREFAVKGPVFVEIDSAGVQTSRGTVSTDGNPATISSNGDGGGQLLITSAGNAFCYDLTANTLTQIAFLDGKATMGISSDGFGLVLDASTSTVWISDVLDFTTWDPTQFIQRSQAPDPLVAIGVSNKYLYFIGSQTGEVWFNAGTSPIPFQPHPSGLFNFGCSAPWSLRIVGSAICWLGSSVNGAGQVLRATGFQPDDISTYATEYAFSKFSTVADAIGDSYDELGHTFYILSFPTGKSTWAWDEQTQSWAERGDWISSERRYDVWRPCFHAFAFNQHRMLSLSSAEIYVMSPNVYTDSTGNGIRWLRRAPSIVQENRRVFYGTFELFMGVGHGLTATPTGNGLFLPLNQTSRRWSAMCVAMNGDVFATVENGDIYKQTAGSGDFVATGETSRDWSGICQAPNGNFYACTSGTGALYLQTGGTGAFVEIALVNRDWRGICATLTNDIYATVDSGDIYKQTGGTGSFLGLSQTSRAWRGIISDRDGIVYAVTESGPGDIYQEIAGTFTSIAAADSWLNIAIDPSLNKFGITATDAYKQTLGAGSFVAMNTGYAFSAICAYDNGSLYACVDTGDIYRSDLLYAQGTDPQVMMRFSNDGGLTWSNEEWRSAGRLGDYGRRVRWTRGGSGRKRVYEVSGSDPVFSPILGAWLEAK